MAAAQSGYVLAFYVWQPVWARGPTELNFDDSVTPPFLDLRRVTSGCWHDKRRIHLPLFAIPFFKRITGFALIGGDCNRVSLSFLHSNYPQEPPHPVHRNWSRGDRPRHSSMLRLGFWRR